MSGKVRSSGIVIVAVALLAWSVAPSASQQLTPGGELSLGQAIALAREHNSEYLIQQNRSRSSSWGVRAAYANLVPSVSASSSLGYTAGGERRLDDVRLATQPATYSSRYGVSASLSLNGSTLLGPVAAKAQARADAEQFAGATASLEAEVTQRYLSALEARDAAAQGERQVARNEEHLVLAQARYAEGFGTALDVARAEVQLGQAQVRAINAASVAANEMSLLGQVLGTRMSASIALTEPFELFEPTWALGELIDFALHQNPTLRAGRAQVDAAATRARVARSAYIPTLFFSAGISGFVSQSGLGTGTLVAQELQAQQSRYSSCLEQNQIRSVAGLAWNACTSPGDEAAVRQQIASRNRVPFDFISQPLGASVGISLPLFNGLNRELQVEEARIARSNAEHQVRAQELRLTIEVETALRNVQAAYRTALLQHRITELAAEELRLATERFNFGLTANVEIVDAQANLAEVERAAIAAVYGFHRSVALLAAQLGGSLAGAL